MTTPDAIAAIREYHEGTKLAPGASNAPRRIEATLVPRQYKRYTGLEAIPLAAPSVSGRSLFEVLSGDSSADAAMSLADLAAVLYYASGIVRRRVIDGREVSFRAASCTGALYHVELYIVCGEIDPTLPAGVYHYDVPANTLRRLRNGDYRRALADACCDEAISSTAASVVLTSTFWRNAWRYEERAYRHVFWDGGTLLANLLAIAESHALRPVLYTAFVDDGLNALLDVDSRREAAIGVVYLGHGTTASASPDTASLGLATDPLSRVEIEYPLIWQTHAAAALDSCEAVSAWRVGAAAPHALRSAPVPDVARTLEESIERRASARSFSQTPLSQEALDVVLDAAIGSIRSDAPLAGSLIRPLVIVNRVDGLANGTYEVGENGSLTLIAKGDFAAQAGYLALDQAAAGGAAVNLYFIADLDAVTAALGGRGYRAVQLEAGIRTGQVYLAASAMGLKASGLTFYDDEVATFFGHDPEKTLVLMLVVFGA